MDPLNPDSEIEDGKAMQDSGSKDYVDLPSSIAESGLKELRDQLDEVDTKIASLLNQRMDLADKIGKIKQEHHLNLTDKNREHEVLDHVSNAVQHPVLKENMGNIYSVIIQTSRNDQQFFLFSTCPFRRIGILGLGLMGGSICKGIKMKDPSIEIGTLVYPSTDYSAAINSKVIDKEYTSLTDLIQNSELLILATPISTIVPLANEIKAAVLQHPGAKLLVIDIASIKTNIVQAFDKLSDSRIEFLSTHPMSGKEKSGFENAQGTLFIHNPWVIIPHPHNTEEAILKTQDFIRFFGAASGLIHADHHDKYATVVSHIPWLLSCAYLDFVTKEVPDSLVMAGTGFKGFTRLAHDNPAMWTEIEAGNRPLIQQYLGQWLKHLETRGS